MEHAVDRVEPGRSGWLASAFYQGRRGEAGPAAADGDGGRVWLGKGAP